MLHPRFHYPSQPQSHPLLHPLARPRPRTSLPSAGRVAALVLAAVGWLAAGTAAGEAASGAPAGVTSRPPVTETLLEEDFSALDLFEGIRKLRPRISLTENVTIDQDYGSAETNRFESGLRTSVVAPLSRVFAIRVVGEFSGTVFDFHGNQAGNADGASFVDTNRPADEDPFDDLLSSQLRVEGRYQMFDTWALVGGTEVSSQWEAGSAYERGLQGSGFFGLGHLFADQFSIVAGVGMSSRLSRSGVTFSPVVRLGWRVTPNVEIETRGLGLNVAVELNKEWALFARGGLRSSSYRLDERGGELGRGVIQDRALPVLFGARWKITKHLRVRAAAGAVVYQKLVVRREDGDFFDSATSRSPAFTGNLELEYRF